MNQLKLYYQLPNSSLHKEREQTFSFDQKEALSHYLAQYIWKDTHLKHTVTKTLAIPKEKQDLLWQSMQQFWDHHLYQAICQDLHHIPWVSAHLHMQGYFLFSSHYLKRYLLQLARKVWQVLKEKEEEEAMIALLQSFLDIAEPLCDEVFLKRQKNGEIAIFDKFGFDLKQEYQRKISTIDINTTEEDVILSALITLAPKQITLSQTLVLDLPIVWQVFREKIRFSD